MLPDTRTELERQNVEGLMIAFMEAKRIHDKQQAERKAAERKKNAKK